VSHPKIGHFGQYLDAWRCGMKAGESRQAEPKKRPGRKICEATLLSKGAFRRIGSYKGKVTYFWSEKQGPDIAARSLLMTGTT
jgi:hypothetical protein